MSASLVATTLNTPNIIPGDSRLPQHRINKIHENEIKAQETKVFYLKDHYQTALFLCLETHPTRKCLNTSN
jgi:hypothetical protein